MFTVIIRDFNLSGVKARKSKNFPDVIFMSQGFYNARIFSFNFSLARIKNHSCVRSQKLHLIILSNLWPSPYAAWNIGFALAGSVDCVSTSNGQIELAADFDCKSFLQPSSLNWKYQFKPLVCHPMFDGPIRSEYVEECGLFLQRVQSCVTPGDVSRFS